MSKLPDTEDRNEAQPDASAEESKKKPEPDDELTRWLRTLGDSEKGEDSTK